MNRVVWELRRAQWRLGTFGLVALLLFGASAIVALAKVLPLRTDVAARQRDLDARAARLKQPPPPLPDEATAPASADQRYFIFLHSLHAIAAKNGLSIPQITYQLPSQDSGSVRRYLVDASFTTSYLQLRSFINELRRQPGVRCERLRASRPTIADTQLEVRLQCSFLVEASR